MIVALTGASGFVGRQVAAALGARGHRVRALGRTLDGDDARVVDLAASGLDVALDAALAGAQAIVHAAAHLPRAYDDPAEARRCFEVNALGTLAVLEAATRAEIRKVVVLSTNLYRLATDPVTEDAPLHPSARASHYMLSKACADFYAQHFGETGRLDATVLRLASVYGPALGRGLIPLLAAKLASGARVAVPGGGRYRADFVHVDDVATATAAAVERAAGGVYNVGSGVASTPLEVATMLARLLDVPAVRIDIQPETGPELQGFPALDVTRARHELGHAPRSLARGLADYLAALPSEPA